ncbi:hypothetical protein Tco_1509246 [Tanacetum coccineum]
MVAYLQKSKGNEGFHEIIDFLSASHIHYALIENPTIYVSFIKQFWTIAAVSTRDNGEVELTATIDGQVKTLTEASLRRHLKLEDHDGVTSLPNSEIFEQLALMGYVVESDKLTFQKVPLFPAMINPSSPSLSPLRITSLPSLSPEPSPSTSQPYDTPDAEEVAPTPHTSPLHSAQSLGRNEGSLSLQKLTVLYASLSKKIEGLESELKHTKQTYNAALTKLIKRVKKLEQTIKISKTRRMTKIEKQSGDTKVFVEDQGSGEKGEREVSTAGAELSTGKDGVNTASGLINTADVSIVSEIDIAAAEKAKEKGKGIITEPEPPRNLKKRVQVQLTVDEELAKMLFEEEQARFNAE